MKTLEKAKDQILGKPGTERRDNYEKELKKELKNKKRAQSLRMHNRRT